MAAAFLNLVVAVLWPLILAAIAWGIAVKALAERDEISKVVDALTGPDSLEKAAKQQSGARNSRNSDSMKRSGDLFRAAFKLTRHSASPDQRQKAER
jgi:hypothetical protein